MSNPPHCPALQYCLRKAARCHAMEYQKAAERRALHDWKEAHHLDKEISPPSRINFADFVDFGDEKDPQRQVQSARATTSAGGNPERSVEDGEKAGAVGLGEDEAGAAVAGEGAASGIVAAAGGEGAGTAGEEEGEEPGKGVDEVSRAE